MEARIALVNLRQKAQPGTLQSLPWLKLVNHIFSEYISPCNTTGIVSRLTPLLEGCLSWLSFKWETSHSHQSCVTCVISNLQVVFKSY